MIKQVIVIRRDLGMRRGKEIAQGSHASIAFLTNRIKNWGGGKLVDTSEIFSPVEWEWVNGIFTKVCLQVQSEKELLEINETAKKEGLECHLIQDSGKTEFNGVPTFTCLALGPDESEKIDKVTRHLKLY